MNAKFEMSKIDLEQAVREYFASRSIPDLKSINFKTTPLYDAFDRQVSGYDISAIVEVPMIPEQLAK